MADEKTKGESWLVSMSHEAWGAMVRPLHEGGLNVLLAEAYDRGYDHGHRDGQRKGINDSFALDGWKGAYNKGFGNAVEQIEAALQGLDPGTDRAY